jgi:hypothetical protein
VRARASATSAATRREVEQSIARFEKRLDDANDALQTLGKNLGRGAQSSYKEVTAALRALRRDAAKTNKQALKDFDKLRTALTPTRGSASSSRSTRSTSRSTSGAARSTTRSTASRASGSRAPGSRASTSRASGSRSTASRSTASKSRSTSSRSGGTRSSSSRAKKS